MRLVLEAGAHTNWLCRLTERLGHEPLTADTHRLTLVTQSLSKDDQSLSKDDQSLSKDDQSLSKDDRSDAQRFARISDRVTGEAREGPAITSLRLLAVLNGL